jgi:hypothetical protein
LDNYDYLEFGSIADDIRDLPAQVPPPLEAVYVWAGLGTSSEVLCDVSAYLIASMLPLSHLCGPLQEALIISLPDEGESVAGFYHLKRSLWTGILVSSL